ncbi:non-ribosomal peptide synthetase [Sorangium sp. So ce1128]
MKSSHDGALTPSHVDGYAISPLQRSMAQALPGFPTVPCDLLVHIDVPAGVDDASLRRAFRELAQRHDLLRSDYPSIAGMAEPLQVIRDEARLEVGPSAAPSSIALPDGPRLSVEVLERTAAGARLRLRLPSFIADPYSATLIASGLAAELGESPRGPAGEIVRYADVAQYLWDLGRDEASRASWRAELSDVTDVAVPSAGYDRAQTHELFYELPRSLQAALRDVARQRGWAYQDVFLGAFYALLYQLTGQSRLPLCIRWNARRVFEDLRGILGPLSFPVPFHLAPAEGVTFAKLQEQIRGRHDGMDQRALAYPALRCNGAGNRHRFELDFCEAESITQLGGVRVRAVQMGPREADLALCLTDFDRGSYAVRFQREQYSEQDIDLFSERLQAILEQVAWDPDIDVARLRAMSEREYQRTVHSFNATERAWDPDKTVLDAFEAQARTRPAAIAVRTADVEISYQQLSTEARRVARWLEQCGVGGGDLVPLYVDRQPLAIAAMIGVVMAGAAYVPLNTALPPARIAELLERLAPRALITCRRLGERLVPPSGTPSRRLMTLDAGWSSDGGEPAPVMTFSGLPTGAGVAAHRPSSDDVAYVIFTSGSTGEPKGVVVRHKRLMNLVDWINRTQGVSPSDCTLLVTAFSFDLSVYDVWGTLAAGATIRLATDEELTDPQRLVDVLASEPISIWDSAPAALQRLTPLLAQASSTLQASKLRLIMLSGDWIPVTLPDELRCHFPRAHVLAMGGATEATIWSNYHEVTRVDPRWPSIPYGRPMQNCRYYVLDQRMRPRPIGVPGELFIGGLCVADGYYNDAHRTDERFLPDPFVPGADNRLYRTGDVVRHLGHGELQFLGRADEQVKIRGYRVELGEISVALRQHGQIKDVILRGEREPDGSTTLVAYYLPQDPHARPEPEALTAFLAERLPPYAIPAHFIALERIPVTSNGKVDYTALPSSRSATEEPPEAPSSATEARLLAIWRELLGREQLPLTGDFFALGGHSLMAVRLLARVNEEFGRQLRMPTFVENATIRKLAGLLDTGVVSSPSGIGCLRRGSDAMRPLFCVHPSGGHFLCYMSLAQHLGSPHTVYGLQAAGFDEGERPCETVEQLAAHHLAKIRRIQAKGPYHLLGWSLGGVVAFEMARQLVASGEAVAPLTVIDRSIAFLQSDRHHSHQHLLRAFAEDLGGLTNHPFEFDPAQLKGAEAAEPLTALIRRAVQSGALAPDIPEPQVRALFHVFSANIRAMNSYRPKPVACDMVHFVGARSHTSREPGWEKLAMGSHTRVDLQGDHFSVMRERGPLDVICSHLEEQLSIQRAVR